MQHPVRGRFLRAALVAFVSVFGDNAGMARFRFGLKDLLISTALFAVGFGCLVLPPRIALFHPVLSEADVTSIACFYAGPIVIGAAIGALYQRIAYGALVGFVLALAVGVLLSLAFHFLGPRVYQ